MAYVRPLRFACRGCALLDFDTAAVAVNFALRPPLQHRLAGRAVAHLLRLNGFSPSIVSCLITSSYTRKSCSVEKMKKAAYPPVTCPPKSAQDWKKTAPMRGSTVRGSSCPSVRKHARRRARQEAIEMARDESLGQAIADDSRNALDRYAREGARQLLQRALERGRGVPRGTCRQERCASSKVRGAERRYTGPNDHDRGRSPRDRAAASTG